MNRKEIAVLAGLILLLLVWPMMGPRIEQQFFPRPPVAETPAPESAPSSETSTAPAAPPALVPARPEDTPPAADAEAPAPTSDEAPEQTLLLTNEVLRLTLSNRGGGFTSALLSAYRQTVDKSSEPVFLDFEPRRALAYQGLAGLDAGSTLSLEETEPGRGAMLRGRSPAGVAFERAMHLDDRYVVLVSDVFSNATAATITLPQHSIELGMMRDESGGKVPSGMYFLGVDAQLHGGRGVVYYGKKILPKAVKGDEDGSVNVTTEAPVDWLAAKNRYFTQILRPDDDTLESVVHGAKENPRARTLMEVSGSIVFPAITLEPGQTYQRTLTYYAGPKEFAAIRELRNNQAEVMEFGMFSPICKFLLWTLNLIHDRLWPHNYGVAIMLLTIIIRGIFWPITHKGTENMRKMQELAPLLQQVKDKYKDNPQKQQQAMMEIYRENKVNPLGGCMPMLIQIPVFFALFVVLRSGIELRFAEFLWIRDLSEPENLFKGILPFGLGLNILPIVNAASMALQQKLTPTSADPRQAQIMMFMPFMMLVLFYNFASGLVLYWTTNQVVMMVQQVLYHRRRERQKAA